MVEVTYFTKFKLLLWKNWLLQWNHKFQMIAEVVIPVFFTLLIVILRQLITPTKGHKLTYGPHPISLLPTRHYLEYRAARESGFEMPLMSLPYSPINTYLESIVNAATATLQLDQHKGFPDAQKLEEELYRKNYLAGIEFEDSMKNLENYPQKLKFALRFPGDLRTSRSTDVRRSWLTSRLFPFHTGFYPRNANDSNGGTPIGYYNEGFLAIQHALSMAFISLSQSAFSNRTQDADFKPMLQLQRFPYPEYLKDVLLEGIQNVVSMILLLSFIYPCLSLARYVAYEKEKQLKEIMKIMGVSNWIHWCAWFVKAFVSLTFSTIIMLVLLMVKWSNEVAVFTQSDGSALFLFMIVYVIVSISFCFMLAVFFSKASTAAAVTGLVWFITYIPYLLTIEQYNELSNSQKLGLCLISNTAMAFGLKIILGLEGVGEGLQWSNFFEPFTADDELTVGATVFMMLLDAVIYMLVCLYVEQVIPGDFGIPQKWYFPVSPQFWCPPPLESSDMDAFVARKSRRDINRFEPDPKDLHVGLEIVNLKKRFGDKWAVRGLSLNMYEDEITVLLGHNGAGKTTTISMLVGMFPPTSGTAVINGYDILTDLSNARGSLGICPQHNVLFDDMSVANHIVFFCRLKGLDDVEIKSEIKKFLRLIDLEKKANVASRKLSGGMQRKLSVCCALCGGTKVVLLDEPSSGMDPSARRHMWNLIQGEKQGRTMLITTHFMDEADVLGDRIAIMSGGELKCHGTPFFLKKKFGSGYRLVCIKRDNCNIRHVTALLQRHIPGIQPDSDLGAELAYQLPYEYSKHFEALLKDLEENSENLNINGYGIGITSIEEVFLKVGAEHFGEEQKMHKFNIYQDEDAESLQSNISFGGTIQKTRKPNLIINQWRAMLLKKVLFTWRKKVLFFMQLFMVIFFVCITVAIARRLKLGGLPPLNIELKDYPAAVVVLEITNRVEPGSIQKRIANHYESYVDSFGPDYKVETTEGKKMEDYILKLSETKQSTINMQYVAGATIDKDIMTAWLNNQPLHTAPLTMNLLHNAISRALLGQHFAIEIVNKPLKPSEKTQINNLHSGMSLGGQLAPNICFCMSFVTSLYVIFIIQENESKAKLLQFVSGVRVWIFWFTQLIWDMITFIFSAVVLVITLGAFQEDFISEFEELGYYFILIVIFGFSALSLNYVLSPYFAEPATGFARLSLISIFFGMALFVIVMVMSNPLFDTKSVADNLLWIFMIYPHFSLALGINELYVNSALDGVCNSKHMKELPVKQRCTLIKMCCDHPGRFDWKRPGIGAEIFYLICVGIGCLLVLIAREYRLLRDLVIDCKRRLKRRYTPPPESELDSDVIKERNRIMNMTKSEINDKNLVLNRVTKYFDQFLAVNQISLCVSRAECFGLLGVNGAGKTTTFKILTGDEKMSYGQAYVRGYSVLTEMNTVYTEIGYCPQFDALLEDLTGREVLRIFCLLRGVPSNRIKYLTEELAKAFGFLKHIDKPVRNYSGGNKRKVSTSVAVLGNPSVVYLDEPTTGMDPGARRRLWNVVCMVRDTGRSIVLTSHSMEECEALCTRLAIMVNGEFKCIGSIQHLKNKFSKGFILKIKIKTFTVKDLNRASSKVGGESTSGLGSNATLSSTDRLSSSLVSSTEDAAKDYRGSIDSYQTPGDFETETDEEGRHGIRLKEPSKSISTRSKYKVQLPGTSLSDDESRAPKKLLDSRGTVLKPQSIMRQAFVDRARYAIQERFPTAILQEYYHGMLTFYLPLPGVTWSEIFGFMENTRERNYVEDYAITQTTLEEIFLDFAQQQVDMRTHSPRKGCCQVLKTK